MRGLSSPYERSTSRFTITTTIATNRIPALEHRIVAVLDRRLQPGADAREGEDRLGEDRAREQKADLEADDRRDRQHRVAEDVAAVDLRWR